MRILVCGGAGYIGSHMVRKLIQAGHDPVIFDNLSTGHAWAAENAFSGYAQGQQIILGDLLDPQSIGAVFSRYGFAAVMHFSACIEVGESVRNPAKYYNNNVVGSLNLLRAMQNAGVDKFVFSSTCAIHGIPELVPIVETLPARPINPYGASKLMVEMILKDFSLAYGLKSVALRYFNAAGADPAGDLGEAHEPESHLIPNAIKAALEQGPMLRVFGADYPTPDGTCLRDYIHVADLADAHLRVLDHLNLQPAGTFDMFNVGTGTPVSVLEIINSVESVSGRRVPHTFAPRREGDPPALYADAGKARRLLNWSPKFTAIDDIVRSAWNWHRNGQSR